MRIPTMMVTYVFCRPSKHAGSDPEAFCLRPVIAITASVQPQLSRIRLPASVSVPFFQRRHGPYCAKPTGVRSGWPGQGLATRISSGSKLESSDPVSGRTHPARYQFPTFRLGSVLPQTSRIILCKTSPDPIYFWVIVSCFGQMDPVRKQAGVQESSGPLLASASQTIRTGCESNPACLLGKQKRCPMVSVCRGLWAAASALT